MPRHSSDGVSYRDTVEPPGYCVGDDGSLWSRWERVLRNATDKTGERDRRSSRATLGETWQRRRLSLNSAGYYAFGFRKRTYLIHRVVLEAFVGPCPPGMEACHNDGNPTNNALSNLRWDTRSENNHDRVKHGTMVAGAKHPGAKLTDEQARTIRIEYAAGNISQAGLARKYHVSPSIINFVILRKHYAYVD